MAFWTGLATLRPQGWVLGSRSRHLRRLGARVLKHEGGIISRVYRALGDSNLDLRDLHMTSALRDLRIYGVAKAGCLRNSPATKHDYAIFLANVHRGS